MKVLYHLSRLPVYFRLWSYSHVLRKAGLSRRPVVCVVGASDDLVLWSPLLRLGLLDVCAFEPSDKERRQLANKSPACMIFPYAVARENDQHVFHNASSSDCSSLLEPDMAVLAPFSVAEKFSLRSTEQAQCRSLDSLLESGEIPQPDFLQMDVQGAEGLVLEGAERLLKKVVAIQLETHLYPIYKSEKPLGESSEWLRNAGFVLVNLEQQGSFGGESVEFNASYLRLVEPDDAKSILLQKFFLAACGHPGNARGRRSGLHAFN